MEEIATALQDVATKLLADEDEKRAIIIQLQEQTNNLQKKNRKLKEENEDILERNNDLQVEWAEEKRTFNSKIEEMKKHYNIAEQARDKKVQDTERNFRIKLAEHVEQAEKAKQELHGLRDSLRSKEEENIKLEHSITKMEKEKEDMENNGSYGQWYSYSPRIYAISEYRSDRKKIVTLLQKYLT